MTSGPKSSSSSSILSSSSNTSLRQKFISVFKSKNSSKSKYKPSLPKHDESDDVDRRFVTAFDSVKGGYIQQPMNRGAYL